jgi:hypothetical protein
LLLSRCAWCCGRGRHAAWVSRVPSLRRVWYRGRGRGLCAAWVSRPQSLRRVWAAVAVFALRVVSRLRSPCRVGVAVAAVALRGCCGCRHCAAWVSRSPSLRHVCCTTCSVAGAVIAPCGCCGRRLCAVCGDTVAVVVVAPRVVTRSRSLHRVGVAVAVFAPRVVMQSRSLRRMGVVGAVFAPRVVLQLLSSRCAWHRGRCCRAVWCRGRGRCAVGVAAVVIAPRVGRRRRFCTVCGVAVAVNVLRGRRGHGRRAVWCCGRGGCRRAAWCRSHGHCRHIVTGPQKRRLVEKRKGKTYQQADAVRAATSVSRVVTTSHKFIYCPFQ